MKSTKTARIKKLESSLSCHFNSLSLPLGLIFAFFYTTQLTRQRYPRKLGFFISSNCNNAECFVSAGDQRHRTCRAPTDHNHKNKVGVLVIHETKTGVGVSDLHPPSLQTLLGLFAIYFLKCLLQPDCYFNVHLGNK